MQYWFDLFDSLLTRRDALRIGRDAAALLALGACSARRGDPAPPLRESPFDLGVASGDPLPEGVVLWTRLSPRVLAAHGVGAQNIAVHWEVAEDDAFRRVVRRGSALARRELGHSVHAEVEGLRSARAYWYRFITGGHSSAIGRTRTAPARGADVADFRFAFASCQNYEHGLFTAFRHLASEEVDLIVHLGDYIYERRFDSSPPVREHEAGEVFTLDQYRARYALYRSDADLQAAHAAAPWVATTDDHEVVNNYAADHPPYDTPRETFLLRRAAAYQAFYEFMPLRRTSLPAGPDMRLYRRLRFGSLMQMDVVDTRQYRTDQPCGDGRKPLCDGALDPAATLLGEAQERWLFDGLRDSYARWHVMANQVLLAQLRIKRDGVPTLSMDSWDGYVAARSRLLRSVTDARLSNFVVLTGDIHSSWVADLKLDFDQVSSRTVGTELVGTSISSGGDGVDAFNAINELREENPHIRYHNARRGYVYCHLTPERWTAAYRTIPYVSRPGAPVGTAATFTLESGRPGAQAG